MDPHLKVALFISIGAVVGFLPLLFVKREETSLKVLFLIICTCLGLSVAMSTVLAMIGNCSFFEAFSMESGACRHFPFASPRVITVMNVLAFSVLVLMPVAILRDLVVWVRRNRSHGKL
ncbi:hypothetical protein LPB19_13470 [Marinobacter salinisoli]|uniref:Uncharacterized protein n=1 Tax=Marinobacter salinisoli TaxID=2769486 RepID=A0ABX7MRY4_9GAMM|nr:hypothetical protein [Marinobacter salinisoli]QSP94190.1 hypothetical protein LPB19_13470 [Marinobacter salinisoli]